MRNGIFLLLIAGAAYTFPMQGCTGSKGTVSAATPGFVAVNLTEAVLTTDDVNPTPNPNKVPRAQCTQCNGTGRIVHGDGHSTECPNCYAFFGPLQPGEVQYVDFRVPLNKPVNLECDCEKCGCSPCNCAPLIKPATLKKQGGCSSGSCGTQGGGSCSTGSPADCGAGSCASGSCGSGGSGSDGPRFTGPVRRIGGFFRERRPVRRLLGRLFGRR